MGAGTLISKAIPWETLSPASREIRSRTILGRTNEGEPRYYCVGRRPLDSIFRHAYQETPRFFKNSTLRAEHWQFISPDGSNFGMLGDGVVQDDSQNLRLYSFDGLKHGITRYNADCIDQARTELQKEWEKTLDVAEKFSEHPDFPKDFDDSWRYNLTGHNCQDYVEEVLERAESIAKKKGVPFIIEDAPQSRQERQDGNDAHPGKILYPYMN